MKKIGKIKVRAIVFDYGNTLLHDPFYDVLKIKMKRFREVLGKSGYNFGKKEIIEAWRKADNEINYPHISHFAQEEPIIIETLRRLNVKIEDIPFLAPKILSIYREGYKEILNREKKKRKKEILETIEALTKKGKKLGIFSNGRKFDLDFGIKTYGIEKYFDFILSSEEAKVEKPDLQAFKIIIKKLNEFPENIVYVGDDPVKDVKGAKKAKMKAILYIPPKKYRKTTSWRNYNVKVAPDAKITRISQLSRIIE
jgi:putative hydrolase of the HAD superfamily